MSHIRPFCVRLSCVGFTVLFGLGLLDRHASQSAAADKGKPSTSIAGWKVKPDPAEKAIEWPDALKLSIAQPERQEDILFPTGDSEFVVVGLDAYESNKAELWNLATGERVGVMNGSPQKAIKRALSQDGKYLAVTILDRALANDVEVWSMETGKRVANFQTDARTLPMKILDFAGPGEVLTYTFGQTGGKFVQHLRIWDAATGKPLRQFELDKNLNEGSKYDISPGRNLLANIIFPDVHIFDLQTGQVKGTISPVSKTDSGENVHIEAVRFSPDGTELVLFSHGSKESLLVVHDLATGNVVLKHELPASVNSLAQNRASYKGPGVEFVTEPKGFLLYGDVLIDRDSGLVVWSYQQGQLEFSHWRRILTPVGLIVSTGGIRARKIQSIPFPGKAVQQSLDALKADAPALVKPGEKVKVDVTVGDVRFGKPAEAKTAIEGVLAERLADDGIELSDEGATLMKIFYKEKAGKNLQEMKGGTIRGGGTPTGKTIASTAAEMKITWTSKDGKIKIYEETVQLDPSVLFVRSNETITDEVARQKVFDILKIRLAGLPLPYFVPEDKSMEVLPVKTASSAAAPKSKEAALKEKLEKNKKKFKK